MIFVDTSAFYAILDKDDRAHASARQAWTALLSADESAPLVTSNYVLVESFALTKARLGLDAVRTLQAKTGTDQNGASLSGVQATTL